MSSNLRTVHIQPAAVFVPQQPLPLYASRVTAGFPSPADDYMEPPLDLNQHLVKHPAATFFVRAEGDSMLGAGIHSGDLLVVDRSVTPEPGKIVIAALNGELLVKELCLHRGRWMLRSANRAFADHPLTEESELTIWGVVTHCIHALA